MQCQKHKELLERWWSDQLTESERAALKAQLAACEDCQRELEGSRELWDLMGYMPVPEPSSGEMQANFNAMLDSYKSSVESARGTQRQARAGAAGFWQIFRLQPWLAATFSLILIVGGFGLGFMLNRSPQVIYVAAKTPSAAEGLPQVTQATQRPPQDTRPPRDTVTNRPVAVSPPPAVVKSTVAATANQVQALSEQLHEMRQMMMLSLLQNPSASQRMRAASYASESRTISPDILSALLTTLNNDPNVNVRLTTLDALTQYARNAAVREGLIQSILMQDSPLMQAALADVMLKLQEKRAIPSFKKLLQDKGLNDMVRSRIEQVITRLT